MLHITGEVSKINVVKEEDLEKNDKKEIKK